MPGLVGFAGGREWSNCSGILGTMQQAITHRGFYVTDELFGHNTVWATRSQSSGQQPQPQPLQANSCYLWFDGELYNRQECPITPDGRLAGSEIVTDTQWLLTAYEYHCQTDRPWRFLHSLDGQFHAVLYDARSRQVHLISDRYGVLPLHWTIWQNTLVWVSEIKALLALPGYQPKLDRETVEDFLGIRYPLGDRSWFEKVKRLPAATVLTWNEDDATLLSHRYWTWNDVTLYDIPDRRDIVAELGRLFVTSVERRCHPGERLGIPLSGGLDSRALLAAVPDTVNSPVTVTYGQANCDDVLIAQQVAQKAQLQFNWLEMNAENWLAPRIPLLWQMDAPASIIHLQFSSIASWIDERRAFDVALHGEWADRFDVAQFFHKDHFDKFLCRQLNLDGLARSQTHHQAVRDRAHAYFQSLDSSSYQLAMDSRCRSFISKDWRIAILEGINLRIPCMDNQIQEFWYALNYTGENLHGLYHLMLLERFPKLFKDISWQKAGRPISELVVPLGWYGKLTTLRRETWKKVARKLNKNQNQNHITASKQSHKSLHEFADYNAWLRQEPAKTYITKLLHAPDALYPEYCDRQITLTDWENHLNGQDLFDRIGTVFTLELWMQQLFNSQYRNGIDN
ncbi:asparagine synthase-related protein [Rivularia sp. UHCC 0363]|uniref:asparagine synthase-related protein n=1 Tax=Rivularia sp. UHCC 0363 TaxID=3110244 RepID=UPI002B1EC985|nr:asparagine synthase-related protein [Rivularia sp. UHCC 0363]MEA5597182.1 asparagine synthase-related protein [Rivularia sp. UHCC 0363]